MSYHLPQNIDDCNDAIYEMEEDICQFSEEFEDLEDEDLLDAQKVQARRYRDLECFQAQLKFLIAKDAFAVIDGTEKKE